MDAFLNCNQCGKCCNSGPSLAFSEVFKFQDKFVMGLYCQAQSDRKSNFPEKIMGSPVTDADHKMVIDHMGQLFGRMNTWDGGFYLQFYPMDIGYSTLKHHSCDQLQANGGCGIHDDKPSMCRSVPFDAMLPESQQALKIEGFMNNFTCLTTTGAEQDLIYREGQIVNPAYKQGYDAKFADLSAHMPFMTVLAKEAVSNSGYMPPAEKIVEVAKRGGRLEIGILHYLVLYMHQIPEEMINRTQQVIDFCANQIALSNELITKAISRKNKAELERTRALRNNIEELKVLSSSAKETMVAMMAESAV
jgi:Fe-S-cluster containining protein